MGVIHMASEAEVKEDKGDDVQWAEDEPDEDDFVATALMCIEDAENLDASLSNNSFLHGATQAQDMEEALAVMKIQLHQGNGTNFEGIRIDTAANRT